MENNDVQQEIENHRIVCANAQEAFNLHVRTCIENTNAQLNAFLILENDAHRRRLRRIVLEQNPDTVDDLTFTVTE
jgi:hypothetical protein